MKKVLQYNQAEVLQLVIEQASRDSGMAMDELWGSPQPESSEFSIIVERVTGDLEITEKSGTSSLDNTAYRDTAEERGWSRKIAKAAERLYLSSLPNPPHPGRMLVLKEALEELRRALYED